MKIEQIYTGCLSHAAYYIESNGEAAIFDPLREVQPYINKASKDQAVIKYVFETHFHADFVSGHLDLYKKTGATIVFGPLAAPQYDAVIAEDYQEFTVGNYTIKVLHTPGHTMESTSYLLIDETGKKHGIITGDTLFIGDVGRPDLAQHLVSDLTQEKLAAHLYDSLRTKIMTLPDHLIIYPNHGAGSACGKMMSKETTDTLGHQKKVNYALRPDMSKEEFINAVLNGLTPPPNYFPQNVLMNVKGYESLDQILKRAVQPLSPEDFENIATTTDAIILDVRHQDDFAQGHIPRSIFIGLNGNFATWAGAMIANVQQPLLIITPEGKEKETVTRLSRVGFDHVLGYLNGGFTAWKKASKEFDSVNTLTANLLKQQQYPIYDVRKESEYTSQHLIGAIHTPLLYLNDYITHYPSSPFYIYCAGGYRSMIAISILKSRGIHNVIDITGGFNAIKNHSLMISEINPL